MNMVTRIYTVRFLTPAFLGDADQKGEWRTPPFKALLRQWWRVAAAKKLSYNHERIREIEGRLFGNAWLKSGKDSEFSKSLLRIRLDESQYGNEEVWSRGTQEGVAPESESQDMKYVAWGLIGRGTGVPNRIAVTDVRTKKHEGERLLRLAFPESHRLLGEYQPAADLLTALALIECFGSIGSRCRNGWGSLALKPMKDQPPISSLQETINSNVVQSLDEALHHGWGSCIGRDQSAPLIWESKQTFVTWGKTLQAIAGTKRHVRRALHLDRKQLSERHILGLPVKDSSPIRSSDARMPSPLRFKVFERDRGLAFRIYGMPHGAPDSESLRVDKQLFAATAKRAWPQIIRSLSEEASGVDRLQVEHSHD